MKFFHFFLFLATFTLISITFNVQAQNNQTFSTEKKFDKIVLQLKWFHQFNFAGYYAAVEKGFYSDAGLEVIIKEGQPGMDFVEEIVSGRANFGVEMPELLIARNKSKPVVALAAIFQHSPQIILAREDSGIRSPQNLINKKVMWRYDSAAELQAMLLNEKVPLEEIDFFELSWDINDLINRKVDAIHAYITDQPFALEKEGIRSTILSPITYGIDFYGDCLFTSEKELIEHPERVKAFREASIKGWEYAMNNPEELIEIIQKKYPTKTTKEYMLNEAKHINQLMLPKLIEIGHMNPGRWKHIGDTFVRLGMLNSDYTLEGFLYDPNPQPDYSIIKKIFWSLLIVTMTISLSAFLLFVFNRKLKKEVEERTNHLSSEITRRKQVELKYLKQNAEFQAIFNSITDAIVFVDLERRILMINPAFTSILGYELEEVKGKTTQFFYANPGDFQQQGKTRFHEGAKVGTPVYEIDYRRKDGSVFTSETLGVPVHNENGETIGFLGIIRDVSERKEAEKEKATLETQLRQAHKMEAIGTLTGGIAHDFNNILAIILGNAELAKFNITGDSSANQNIDQILHASNRAKSLIKRLLTFSRQEKGEKGLHYLCHLVEESMNSISSTMPKSIGLEINFAVKCEENIEDCYMINADPIQIHQLLMNLCVNAVDAMEAVGTLTISVEEVTFTDEIPASCQGLRPGIYEYLSVSDTGHGMSTELAEKIFDPFFTTKEVGKGTGIGLSVVQGIINNHDGYIFVDSKPEQGTTFHMYFPAVTKTKPETESAEELHFPTGNERILIVDDEEMLAQIGKTKLENLGYTVTAKTSGIEAFELFQGDPHRFDLVITDQAMPTMPGSELAKQLLEIRPDIPIILCTGYSSTVDKEKAREIGIREFAMKPLDNREIAQLIRKVLDEGA